MSQATRPNDRHIIWSNQNLDVDDWREDYKEFLEANELDDDPNDEQALYEWMEETNYDYLSDERVNLNVQLSQPIIVIGDIGRWNGRVMGYKDIPSGNIRDCLYADTDYTEWYVDKYGDLRADAAHHDGTNHYLYRVFKEGVSETQMENLRDKIYHGKATRADITRLTRRLGDEIAAVYGFDIPKQRTPKKGAQDNDRFYTATADRSRTQIHLRSKLAASRADRQYRLSAWGLRLKRRSVLYHLV